MTGNTFFRGLCVGADNIDKCLLVLMFAFRVMKLEGMRLFGLSKYVYSNENRVPRYNIYKCAGLLGLMPVSYELFDEIITT